jgi:hypothetical protein
VYVVPKSNPITNRVSCGPLGAVLFLSGDATWGMDPDERLVGTAGGGGGRGRFMT